MAHDLRYALRQLVKHPGFTAIATLTLALGIAATTTMFSVVDAVLIHPLPYPHSEQIVTLSETVRSTGVSTRTVSPANFIDWSAQNHVFAAMATSRSWPANFSGGGEPQRIRATMASSSFFSIFDVAPILGRTLAAADAKAGAARVAVLSYAFWTRHYANEPRIIGQDLILDGENFTVIGVMPPNFSPDEYSELWVPSPFDIPTHPLAPTVDPRAFRDRGYLDGWARLKEGLTIQQAQAEMTAIAQRLEREYPDANENVGTTVVPLREQIVGNIRPMLLLLLGAVALVLLIGCANVANLLLARAAARSRELAIRTALGASRWRLVRQLLTESALLALLGGAVGLLLAAWALPFLLRLSPPELAEFTGISINYEVLAFAIAISAATGIVFGVAPALLAARSVPNQALREGERGSSLGRSSARSFLIAAEVAVSLVLLVDAGLLLKSFLRLTQVDPGFNPNGLLVFNLSLPASADASRQTNLPQIIDRLAAVPGVQAIGAVSRLPLAGGNSSRSFTLRGSTQSQSADIRVSTPDYFRTMGIPLLRGRNFNIHDTSTSTQVAIINQATAETVFAGRNPIGETIEHFGPDQVKLQIVGVVGNVRHVGLETNARPEIYLPLTQANWPSLFFVLRTLSSNPSSLLSAAQKAVWSVDPTLPLANARTMQEVLARSMLQRKFFMLLIATFAGLATLLATIGMYGVIAFSVTQRTREIGIRIALGGVPSNILSLILRQSAALVLLGAVIGLPVAFGASQLLGRLLFGVKPGDFATYLFVVGVLSLAAFFASIVPAMRAARVNPVVALRTE